jgi:hypothetical protein
MKVGLKIVWFPDIAEKLDAVIRSTGEKEDNYAEIYE